MKNIVLVLFCLTSLSSFSQNEIVIVNYKSRVLDDSNEFGAFLYERGQLITTNNTSLYIETPIDTTLTLNHLGEVSNVGANYRFSYFKNLPQNQLLYDRSFGLNEVISDNNYRIVWTINSNTKRILSYNCKEATGTFRGRDYRAYFLESIRIPNGPFKFDGLPGLILAVESLDGKVSIVATDITYDESNAEIPNPFTNVNTASWSQFLNFYRSKFNRITGSRWEDSDVFIPNRYIELFTVN